MRGAAAKELSEWLNSTIYGRGEHRILVVAILGRSSFEHSKAECINQLLGMSVFVSRWTGREESSFDITIDAFYSAEHKTLFLHLNGMNDSEAMMNAFQSGTLRVDKGFYERMAELETNNMRLSHLVFLVSHLVVFIEPCCRFDLNLARFMRSVNYLRQEMASVVSEALEKIPGVSKDWVHEGRLCAPRLLFGFYRSPLRPDLGSMKRKELTEKLERSMEDQIYNILRKSRIVTNNRIASVASIPSKSAFVHIFTTSESPRDMQKEAMGFILNAGNPPTAVKSEEDERRKKKRAEEGFAGFLQYQMDEVRRDELSEGTLKPFFEVSAGHLSKFFQLPKLKVYMETTKALFDVLIKKQLLKSSVLSRILNVESEFSQARCKKILPLAVRLYEADLPPFYSTQQHQIKVEQAMHYLRTQCRGPELEEALRSLQETCENVWKSQRQACEVISLTGVPCTMPIHLLPGAEKMREGQMECAHSSKARYLSTCNCGFKQTLRNDPFTVKEANFDFFEQPGFQCCKHLEKYELPVFQPEPSEVTTANVSARSDDLFRTIAAEDIALPPERGDNSGIRMTRSRSTASEGVDEADVELEDDDLVRSSSALSDRQLYGTADIETGMEDLDMKKNLSPRFARRRLDESEEHSPSDRDENEGPNVEYEDEDEEERAVVVDSSSQEAIQLAAAESATLARITAIHKGRFLETMPYSETDDCNLDPLFPSWAILCLGSSSIYTHATGLRDMPNFSHGSQYLLPWDCTLKVDVDAWDRGMDEIAIITGNVKPRRPRKTGENLEKVKLFVGFEYECPRGHRFMLQTPEKMLKYSGPGGPKDNAAAIVKSEMPLWFPCGCRSTPRVSGQLMRVHVVTPKAPIAVALNPRVQANVAETGFFHPGNRGQIQLTWGKYYILRLPYAYVGLSGPVYPPKEPTIAGRVLKNMITVSYCPV